MTPFFITECIMQNDNVIQDLEKTNEFETLETDIQWVYAGFVWAGTAFGTFVIITMLITATISTPIPFYLTTGHCKFISITMVFILIFCSIHATISYHSIHVFSGFFQSSAFHTDLPLCAYMD